MQLKLISLMVKDQEQALRCYSEVIGFRKMADIPMGEYRWLTVTSPDDVAGVELVPEPMAFPPSRKQGVSRTRDFNPRSHAS